MSLDLIFIYGLVAVGKYTIGRELAARTGYRFFHNHLVVDTALSIYEFGTPGFIALRETLWREVFLRAAQDKDVLPGLLFTFTPESSVSQEFIDWLFGDYAAAGVRIFSVNLLASEAAIEQRLDADSRRTFGKLTDLALYRRARDAGIFRAPTIPRTDLTIDTESCSPADAAAQIAQALGQPLNNAKA